MRANILSHALIWARVCPEPNTGCWLWTRFTDPLGYGKIKVKGLASTLAHRASYEAFVGSVPRGLSVLHRCDTPSCVNPTHLFLGTHATNMADRSAKGRQARGARHGSRTMPGCEARGERNGRYTMPGCTARGERVSTSKLTEAEVLAMRAARASGVSAASLAKTFGVSDRTVYSTVLRQKWRHV